MPDIKIITHQLGPIETNCYFAINQETGEVLIIDPASNADFILEKCEELKIKPKAILLTHGHYDHTGAVGELKEKLNLPVYAGTDEKVILSEPAINGTFLFTSESMRRGSKPVEADMWLLDNEMFEPAGFPVRVISTPGHTAGGVCYYIAEKNVLFSGDVLFADSFGRTDLPTGNSKQLVNSIINRLFILPEETKVYPGHGDSTTIGKEKNNNPIYRYM